MPSLIKVLPEEVASQIAAGEVVERPVSVVKELIENSLDAGATQISVSIMEAGKSFIQVNDNGGGVPFDELPLMVARYATSKLSRVEDLFHIQTLGFRGEALASIASVSRMTILSNIAGKTIGGRLSTEGGKKIEASPNSTNKGTTVLVENLFFNVPARLKFLKSNSTEKQLIETIILRYALAYPLVSFELKSEGKPIVRTFGKGDQREILFQVYGIEIGKQMIETQFLDGEYALKGFISPTSLTRANRKEIIFFMNGRWIQDANLTTAFLQGYHSFLMVGRYPMGIIFLTIPAEDVDINVHPTKTSVRFQQPDRIFGLVRGAVKKTLSAKSPFPEVNFPVWEWKAHAETNSTIEFHKDPKDEIKKSSLINPGMVPPISGVGTRASLEGLHSLPLLRVIGQVALAYIITEGPDGLYLIDQHAAHERVLFEKFISQIGTNHLSQSLLEAYKVEIPVTKISIVPEILPILQHLGFSIEPFGGSAFLVRAIPALFTGIDPGRLFLSMIEEFEEDETPLAQELENKLAARICKRAAIKAGKSLTIEEQRRLVEDLEACKKPHHCPHGRPTMIHLSASLLEKQFGRR